MNIKKLVMARFIKDSGIKRPEKEMESGFSSGPMAPSMKESGVTTKQMVKAE